MTDEARSLGASIARSIEATNKGDIGDGISFMLVLIGLELLVSMPLLVTQWNGHFYDRKGCVELKEAQVKFYLMDTCSGRVSEFSPSLKTPDEITRIGK